MWAKLYVYNLGTKHIIFIIILILKIIKVEFQRILKIIKVEFWINYLNDLSN